MLGGLGEIGKNIAVIESGNDIIVVDCGLGFPDDDMLGVDLVIPDVSYLEKNEEKVRGIFITHGHEDHIGALPYVLRNLHVPVYATRLTLGVLERKLSEFHYDIPPVLNCVEAGDTVKAGVFSIEFIRVNHSIADACALAIHTPAGVIIHSGDFKLDLTPVESQMMDITRLGELGNEGVMLLMCESTNAERPGFTPSERKVGGTLDEIFLKNKDSRIVIATFSSNVHRVQQIISHSEKFGRKVAITGRSMVNIVGVATELGYMTVSDGVLIDIADVKKYPPEQVTVITTGSQGEPMSALYRMAFGDHSKMLARRARPRRYQCKRYPGQRKNGRPHHQRAAQPRRYRMAQCDARDTRLRSRMSGGAEAHACADKAEIFHAHSRRIQAHDSP